MRSVTSVSLPGDLVRAVSRFVKKRGMSVSEVAREAIRDYLYRQELEEARREFTAHVRRKGIFSEEELVKSIER